MVVSGLDTSSINIPTAFTWQTVGLSSTDFYRIISDKPVAVLKTAVGSHNIDPSLVTLTHRDRWSTRLTFAMPGSNWWQSFAMSPDGLAYTLIVVTEEGSDEDITVNGHDNNFNWESVVSSDFLAGFLKRRPAILFYSILGCVLPLQEVALRQSPTFSLSFVILVHTALCCPTMSSLQRRFGLPADFTPYICHSNCF